VKLPFNISSSWLIRYSYLLQFQLPCPSLQSVRCIACFPPSPPTHLTLRGHPPLIPTTLWPNSTCSRENGNYTSSWRSSWSLLWWSSTRWPATCYAWIKITDYKRLMNTPCTARSTSIEWFTPRSLLWRRLYPASVVGHCFEWMIRGYLDIYFSDQYIYHRYVVPFI
jgi:hypothetical protein